MANAVATISKIVGKKTSYFIEWGTLITAVTGNGGCDIPNETVGALCSRIVRLPSIFTQRPCAERVNITAEACIDSVSSARDSQREIAKANDLRVPIHQVAFHNRYGLPFAPSLTAENGVQNYCEGGSGTIRTDRAGAGIFHIFLKTKEQLFTQLTVFTPHAGPSGAYSPDGTMGYMMDGQQMMHRPPGDPAFHNQYTHYPEYYGHHL